jgi:hypothetical protein
VEHEPTPEEISDHLAVVDRDLQDAAVESLSPDWKLGIAYNGALQLAMLALAAEGFRRARVRAHERAILSLRFTVGVDSATIDLLDGVRQICWMESDASGTSATTNVREPPPRRRPRKFSR